VISPACSGTIGGLAMACTIQSALAVPIRPNIDMLENKANVLFFISQFSETRLGGDIKFVDGEWF
jgi:hypothetical protein